MSGWGSLASLADDVLSGRTTATELVERALRTIEEKKEYDAIISVVAERAKERARQMDDQVKAGQKPGRLAGVPFIAKDNFLTFGGETTAASNILRGFKAPYQATAIEKLEAEGAICVAKANLDAFAHGSSTENSDWFTTKNPADATRVPGGSSGGSAAAVMLDMAPFALGTDTGGSIRLPAAFTGTVGYKPTYGLVSRSGVVAMASSTDVIGPIARSVADAALVLDCMAGKDVLDSTTIDSDPKGYDSDPADIKGLKVGVIKEYMSDALDPKVRDIIQNALDSLQAAGAKIEEVSLPSLPLALACYYIIMPAEVSSNLSRYDGQRYGYSYPDAKDLTESYQQSRSRGFGDEAKRRIMVGTYVISSGYHDAYYRQAQLVRTRLISEFTEIFKRYDILAGPTAPTTAFKIGEHIADPLEMYLTDIMTVAANLAGNCAISLPAGKIGDLPVGFQMLADQRQDRLLLSVARRAEELLV
jgi:aspartyl-tRNA(Asn)/glutamyl-tRNA(Gln) amidotransferase subunit A